MTQYRRRKSRVRYDRIIGVVLILIVFILLFSCVFGGDDEKESKPAIAETVQPTTEAPLPKVYLSPSNQTDNDYATGGETEASAMRDLSERVMERLQKAGVEVFMASENCSLQDKVSMACDLNVDAYVALHSNAGGDSGSGEGTECFCNSSIPGSETLAEFVYNEVADLTPTEDRGIKDGTDDAHYLYEIGKPDVPVCLLEVEFHDVPEHSDWILENMSDIADAVTDGILKYLDHTGSMANVTGAAAEATEETTNGE